MATPTTAPEAGRLTGTTTFTYVLLAAAIGAATATLTVFAAFFVLNPTVITQARTMPQFTDGLVFLGSFHMLFCGPPGCLAGAIAAPLPSLLIARLVRPTAGRLGRWALVGAVALVVGLVAGMVAQWAMVQLYAVLFPHGISFQP